MSKPNPPQSFLVDDDVLNPKCAASAFDFLLIEMVPTVQRMTEQVLAREQQLMDEYKRAKIFGGADEDAQHNKREGDGKEEESITCLGFPTVTPPAREAMQHRLDAMGYRVGQGLVERFSANTPRPLTPLDTIKFICKDLWTLLYRKQIDNLKTNHRGIYVLSDARFQPLGRVSIDRKAGGKALQEALSRASLHVAFPAGVVRGALMGLGIEAGVVGECAELPVVTFTIKAKGAKA